MDMHINTVRALMAKTVANGATEQEAMQAMVTAKKLMSKYGITIKDLKENLIKKEDFGWGSPSAKYVSKISVFEKIVTMAIADFTGTKVTAHQLEKNRSNIFFFGHKIDVELAIYMLNVTKRTLDIEWNKYRIRNPDIHGNKIKSFSIGMADRISERLSELMTEEIKYSGTELVVLKNALVESLFAQAMGGMKVKSTGLVVYNEDDSYTKGYESGDKVSLHKQINEKSKLIGKE